jgi:cell division protein FtsB
VARSATPEGRGAARAAPSRRRGWLLVGAGAATGGIILAAWLPVGALLSQRQQLSTTTARLSQLAAEQRALTAEAQRLATPAAQDQLAREQYQLVEPGQRLIQVLTPTFTPTSRSAGGPYPGDPGLAPLADPDAIAGVTAAGTAAGATTSPASHAAPTGARPVATPGFLSRVLGTLEFWR